MKLKIWRPCTSLLKRISKINNNDCRSLWADSARRINNRKRGRIWFRSCRWRIAIRTLSSLSWSKSCKMRITVWKKIDAIYCIKLTRSCFNWMSNRRKTKPRKQPLQNWEISKNKSWGMRNSFRGSLRCRNRLIRCWRPRLIAKMSNCKKWVDKLNPSKNQCRKLPIRFTCKQIWFRMSRTLTWFTNSSRESTKRI